MQRRTCLGCSRIVRPGRASIHMRAQSAVPHRTRHRSRELPKVLQGEQLGPSEDGYRSVRSRLNQGGAPLAIPPFLDERVEARRREHTRGKKQWVSRKNLTPLQRELQNNPFARALMTAVRRDITSDAQAPKFFLQPWQTVFVPTNTDAQPRRRRRRRRDHVSGSDLEWAVADATSEPQTPSASIDSDKTEAVDVAERSGDEDDTASSPPPQQQRLVPRIVPVSLTDHGRTGGHNIKSFTTLARGTAVASLRRGKRYRMMVHQGTEQRFGKAKFTWTFDQVEGDAGVARGLTKALVAGLRHAVGTRQIVPVVAVQGGGDGGGVQLKPMKTGRGGRKGALLVFDTPAVDGAETGTVATGQEGLVHALDGMRRAVEKRNWSIEDKFVFFIPALVGDATISEIKAILSSGLPPEMSAAVKAASIDGSSTVDKAVVLAIEHWTMPAVHALMRLELYHAEEGGTWEGEGKNSILRRFVDARKKHK